MKFIVSVDGKHVVLDATQMEILTTALTGAEALVDIDVGRDNGTHGYAKQYISGVAPYSVHQSLSARVMTNDECEAFRFIAKQYEGKTS
jgi:hypothetical protein